MNLNNAFWVECFKAYHWINKVSKLGNYCVWSVIKWLVRRTLSHRLDVRWQRALVCSLEIERRSTLDIGEPAIVGKSVGTQSGIKLRRPTQQTLCAPVPRTYGTQYVNKIDKMSLRYWLSWLLRLLLLLLIRQSLSRAFQIIICVCGRLFVWKWRRLIHLVMNLVYFLETGKNWFSQKQKLLLASSSVLWIN